MLSRICRFKPDSGDRVQTVINVATTVSVWPQAVKSLARRLGAPKTPALEGGNQCQMCEDARLPPHVQFLIRVTSS
jgi:hypothetical protein